MITNMMDVIICIYYFDKLEFGGEIIMTFGERLYELRKNKNIL